MKPLTGPAEIESGVDSFEIAIADQQSHITVDPQWLRRITRTVLLDEGIGASQISIALVDDAIIHRVNRQFLEHDYPTDVISFPLGDPEERPDETPDAELSVDGEVVVSTETACRSAAEHGHGPVDELALYVIHGLLHLCGYEDDSAAGRQQMRQREKSHLKMLGIPANYED